MLKFTLHFFDVDNLKKTVEDPGEGATGPGPPFEVEIIDSILHIGSKLFPQLMLGPVFWASLSFAKS